MKKEIPVLKVFEAINRIKSKLLKKYFLLDLYENEKLGNDRKNLTVRFTYRNDTQTLEQKQVEKEHLRILETVTKQIHPYLFS